MHSGSGSRFARGYAWLSGLGLVPLVQTWGLAREDLEHPLLPLAFVVASLVSAAAVSVASQGFANRQDVGGETARPDRGGRNGGAGFRIAFPLGLIAWTALSTWLLTWSVALAFLGLLGALLAAVWGLRRELGEGVAIFARAVAGRSVSGDSVSAQEGSFVSDENL